MSPRIAWWFTIGALATCVGCASTPPDPGFDYSAFRAADPHSILIVPVVNNSVDVEASDYFLSAISKPVAERGYYVFPVNMVKRVMEDDGLADADMVHAADPTRLASLFGADSVLYVSIERWDAQYAVLATSVTVEFTYVLKNGRTGETLWQSAQRVSYNSSQGSQDIISALVSAAITKASPNYMPLARQANANTVGRSHYGLPAGPYRPEEYLKDTDKY
jgi:hypothetical protein